MRKEASREAVALAGGGEASCGEEEESPADPVKVGARRVDVEERRLAESLLDERGSEEAGGSGRGEVLDPEEEQSGNEGAGREVEVPGEAGASAGRHTECFGGGPGWGSGRDQLQPRVWIFG